MNEYHTKRLAKDLERLKTTDKILDENRVVILKFLDFMRANGVASATLRMIIWSLATVSTMLGKPFKDATKDDIIGLVSKIEGKYNSEKSKKHLKAEIKRFYKWLRNTKDYPEEVEWIKLNSKTNGSLLPEDILTKEEIERIAKAANSIRDRSLILTLYESGCRISELVYLKIKNIVFDEHGCILRVDGKTGQRRVRVIEYTKDLLDWLAIHPLRDNPESYVWISLSNNSRHHPMTYCGVEIMLKRLARKIGMTKKVNPHAFRHARATHLAKHLPDAIMKEHFGWTKDSKMASVYYHLSGKEVDEKLIEVLNKETRKCIKCGEINPSSYSFCKKCSSPLDIKMLIEVDKTREEFDNFTFEFLKYLAEKIPSVKKAFREFVKERKAEKNDFYNNL